jgi:hypothetical protein
VTEARAPLERRAARYVGLIENVGQSQPVALARCRDTLSLFARRHEPLSIAVAHAANPYHADGTTNGGGFAGSC